ncbi:MAG: GatB/YqeY domain-containing protein [Terracidiphilus sp.]
MSSETGALEVQVNQQIVAAMKARDAERTGTLRLIKNALKMKAIEKRAALSEAEEQQALATMIKQRRDSIEQFTQGKRPELAAREAAEIAVIEEFLPRALEDGALEALVAKTIEELAAATGKELTLKEMGPAIKAVQSRLQTSHLRAEGRAISEKVKQHLAG